MYLSNSFVIKCIMVSLVILPSQGRSRRENSVSRRSCSRVEKIEAEKVRCEPRLQVVPIPKKIHEVFHPNSVTVNRCSGSCLNMRRCTAKLNASRCFAVYNKINEEEEYREVEEHLECHCCDVTPDMCNEKQRFDEDQCKCQCTNETEEDMCWRSEGNWDEGNCVCLCDKEGVCLSSQVWNDNLCRCIDK